MRIIVHSWRLLKRRAPPRCTVAYVPRAAARPKRKKARKRASKAAPKRKPAPQRRPKSKPKRAPAKRSKAKRAPAKRAPAKRSKRATAAKKGWSKRKKKQRLIAAMHDVKWRHIENAQPIGWRIRRQELREINGEIWREISYEYSEDLRRQQYLESLKELEIDMLPKHELQDYFEWIQTDLGEEIDISDLYRMYLGYSPAGMEVEA